MSYETVSVRMNRSDPSIRWGFLLGRRGNDTIITRVEKDSLSEKAGLREGDEVMSVCDRSALDIHDAQRTADSARLEITFHLKRHVYSHNCLPWTLTEKDNKLFVEEIPAGFAKEKIPTHSSSYSSSQNQFQSAQHQQQQQHVPSSGYSSQKQSSYSHNESRSGGGAPWSSERNIPIQQSQQSNAYNASSYGKTQSSNYQGGAPFQGHQPSGGHQGSGGQQGYHSSYSSETKTSHTSGGGAPQPERVFHSPSSFASSMKNTGWNRERQHQLSFAPSAPFHSSPAPAPAAHSPNHSYSAEHFYNPTAAAQAGHANGTAPQSYSYNNGTTATPFGVGSGGVPLNQMTFINTTSPIPMGHSSLSPGGTKVFYHSPSSRTRSQLSPNASIHHLQYNSPMNLYSTDACAEQYEQQTGRGVETASRTTTPAYLTSQTKRLIEEGDALRGPSPSAQSSSFKRISEAVGTPVH